MSRPSESLKGALLGGLVTAVLALIAWGAADRLSAESRIVKLESSAETNGREHGSMIRSIQRLEVKINQLLIELGKRRD